MRATGSGKVLVCRASHIGRSSARLKADLAAKATTLAQSFFRHLTYTRNVHSKAAGKMI
jgi:tRNA A37 threonylcarbamoyladenosine biosynthesis protein TsaE